MNNVAYYKTEISNLLVGFDLKQTTELYSVIKNKSNSTLKNKKNLSGIWKNIDTNEVEKDLKDLRDAISKNLDNKHL